VIAPAVVRPRPAVIRPLGRLREPRTGVLARRLVRLPPFLLAAIVLHTAVLPQVRPFEVGADGLLLVAVCAGLAGGARSGAWVGFGTGLLADCFLASPFGLSALAGGLVGWAVGSLAGRLLRPGFWVLPATVLGASTGGVLLFAGLGTLLGEDGLVTGRLLGTALLVGVLNALLGPAALATTRWALGSERPETPVLEGGR
jgi:rod shape-determining protein MreD